MAGSSMSSPLRMTKTGSNTQGRSAAVTVAALTTNTAELYTITDADAEVGDIILVSPNTAPEAGWGIECTYVSAAGTIKVRARNHSGDTLTGGSLTLNYQIVK
jgi:hypothetical protein